MKQIEKILTSPATWYLAGAVLLTVILRQWGILRGKSKEEKQVAEIKFDPELWGTRLWQDFPEKAFTDKQAENLATHIRQSFGTFNDDEARIYGVFRSIKYRVNVSQIAFAYAKLFGRDLLSDLEDSLSKNEMNNIYQIILQKPI